MKLHHGPLARVELGDAQVQGLDYAYTLQGWLKGVNSSNLDAARDMGRDGWANAGNPNALFARDVMSFSLGYFKSDYTAIDADATWLGTVNPTSVIAANWRELYNGNIGFMSTNLKKQDGTFENLGMVYEYDQLNRLVNAKGFTQFDSEENKWTATADQARYSNAFTYDANGNILTQSRHDHEGVEFENLVYRYHFDDENRLLSNRLYGVNELATVPDSLYSDDIDDQGVFLESSDNGTPNNLEDDVRIDRDNNYTYTPLGELLSDRAEGIAEIIWRTDGKISQIKRSIDSEYPNLGFEYDASGNRVAKHVYSDNTFGLIERSTYYVRDGGGNVLATYDFKTEGCDGNGACYALSERTIYGSSRLGIDTQSISMLEISSSNEVYTHVIGEKNYELSNHLGNVLTVITDSKIYVVDNDNETSYFESVIVSVTDYSPFGAGLKGGRSWSNQEYRYGFQNQEEDSELWGGAVTYKYRIEDPRLGRFFSVDPLYAEFPWNSNYAFSENKTIHCVELEGLEAASTTGSTDSNPKPNTGTTYYTQFVLEGQKEPI